MARKLKRPKKTSSSRKKARVAIIMGSDSDLPIMKDSLSVLKDFGVPYEVSILSAHRTPLEVQEFAAGASSRGVQVIISGAGGAAHLPGVVASFTEVPVIGVPIPFGPLQGQDALYSIVQMPRGVPVASVAIGNATNAALLAVQILASGGAEADKGLLGKWRTYKAQLRKKVLAKSAAAVSL